VVTVAKEEAIEITDEEIADYLFRHLTKFGYAVTVDEAITLGELVFDYLVEKGVIDEIILEEDED
jgi:hypothetical protein